MAKDKEARSTGGVWGCEEMLEAIGNPDHLDHGEMLEWKE